MKTQLNIETTDPIGSMSQKVSRKYSDEGATYQLLYTHLDETEFDLMLVKNPCVKDLYTLCIPASEEYMVDFYPSICKDGCKFYW